MKIYLKKGELTTPTDLLTEDNNFSKFWFIKWLIVYIYNKEFNAITIKKTTQTQLINWWGMSNELM